MLAKHLVLTQSHIPLAFSQSVLSSVLVRDKAGADAAIAITKVSIARFFIPPETMSSKRRRNCNGSAWHVDYPTPFDHVSMPLLRLLLYGQECLMLVE